MTLDYSSQAQACLHRVAQTLDIAPYVVVGSTDASLKLVGTSKNTCCGCNDPASGFFEEKELKGTATMNIAASLSILPEMRTSGRYVWHSYRISWHAEAGIGGKVDIAVGGTGEYKIACQEQCLKIGIDASGTIFVGGWVEVSGSLWHREGKRWVSICDATARGRMGATSGIHVSGFQLGFFDCPNNGNPKVCWDDLKTVADLDLEFHYRSFTFSYTWTKEYKWIEEGCWP